MVFWNPSKIQMRIKLAVIIFLNCIVIVSLDSPQSRAQVFPEQSNKNAVAQNAVQVANLNLFDQKRNRSVPVVCYSPVLDLEKFKGKKLKFAIISHGYGMKNTEYSFIAETLIAHGYFVASVQHELPTDEPLPTTGKPSVVRRPNWERGVQNILFIVEELKKTRPELDFKNLLLVGHSNGGDTTMLFAEKYPNKARKIITLDNRRMIIPRVRKPQILSIRSSDQVADEGVLPTAEEQKKFKIKIVKLANTVHNEMWDGATTGQKREISEIISSFLESKL